MHALTLTEVARAARARERALRSGGVRQDNAGAQRDGRVAEPPNERVPYYVAGMEVALHLVAIAAIRSLSFVGADMAGSVLAAATPSAAARTDRLCAPGRSVHLKAATIGG